jgi:hypothetical protein
MEKVTTQVQPLWCSHGWDFQEFMQARNVNWYFDDSCMIGSTFEVAIPSVIFFSRLYGSRSTLVTSLEPRTHGTIGDLKRWAQHKR